MTPNILKAMSERQFEFTNFKRIRVAMGTWNVNGGKQFKSNILGTSELTDWLLDSPKLSGVSEFQGKEEHYSRTIVGRACSTMGIYVLPTCTDSVMGISKLVG